MGKRPMQLGYGRIHTNCRCLSLPFQSNHSSMKNHKFIVPVLWLVFINILTLVHLEILIFSNSAVVTDEIRFLPTRSQHVLQVCQDLPLCVVKFNHSQHLAGASATCSATTSTATIPCICTRVCCLFTLGYFCIITGNSKSIKDYIILYWHDFSSAFFHLEEVQNANTVPIGGWGS